MIVVDSTVKEQNDTHCMSIIAEFNKYIYLLEINNSVSYLFVIRMIINRSNGVSVDCKAFMILQWIS